MAFGAWKGGAVVDKILDLRYGRTLPPPHFAAPADTAEAQRQDLDYLARLPTVDRSFSPEAVDAFERKVERLRLRAGSLSRAAFLLGVAEAVAQADNAHTNVDPAAWRALLDSVPVRFAWFADGLYVVRATAEEADLLGARVIAVDGVDPGLWADQSLRFFGGTREHARSLSPLLMEAPAALHAIDAALEPDRLRLRVRDLGGRERLVELATIRAREAPPMTKAGRVALPQLLPGEKRGAWRTLLEDATALPPSLREPGKSVHAETLGDGTLYMHLWQVRDESPGSLAQAMRSALGPAQLPAWRRIVLDLRFNSGGDYPAVYPAMRDIASRLAPDGRLVVLTDATTFSAAIITAALAKHFVGDRVRMVGGKPGDRLEFWAEGTSIELPNSKIAITISTGYHDWAHGCREWRCYWPNYFYDVGVGSLDPDVVVGWNFADYARGVDTVLQRALD